LKTPKSFSRLPGELREAVNHRPCWSGSFLRSG